MCHPLENELENIRAKRTLFYTKCLLALGFHVKDFNMGNDIIFFRMNNFHLIDDLKNNPKDTLNSMKKSILRWKWRIAILCVRFASEYYVPNRKIHSQNFMVKTMCLK